MCTKYIFDSDVFERRIKYLNMSYSELSKRTGLSPSTFSEWVNGHHSPSLNTMMVISKEIGIPIEKFIKKVKED